MDEDSVGLSEVNEVMLSLHSRIGLEALFQARGSSELAAE
jgi:hypothetical protein